jgi:hypothetical protein
MADPLRSEAWSLLKLNRYNLAQANEALADVASGKVVKALIAPQS